jgi:hypothetical protein
MHRHQLCKVTCVTAQVQPQSLGTGHINTKGSNTTLLQYGGVSSNAKPQRDSNTLTSSDQCKVEQWVAWQQAQQVLGLSVGDVAVQPNVELAQVCFKGDAP